MLKKSIKMKTNKNHLIKRFARNISFLGIITAIIFTSCKQDILDTVPQTKIADTEAFTTPAQFVSQLNGLYSSIKAGALYGGGYLIWSELRGEEFLNGSQNTGDGAAIYNQNALASADQISGLWSAGYSTINNVNIFIEKATSTTVINDATKKSHIAEAKFLRALSYFSLVQFYSRPYIEGNGAARGLPLRLTGITSLVNGDLAASTVAQVYDQIIKDLNEAEADLPESQTPATLNATRAHKATAIALKTRVYLVKQEWAKVVTEASKIVNASFQYAGTGVSHKLEANIATVFGGSYTGSEAVLFFPFNATDAPGGQRALAYYYTRFKYVTLNPAGLPTSDASVFNNAQDARSIAAGKILIKSGTQIVLNKFPTTAIFTDYVPAIRYAEVLLNYAEAAARTNDLTTAANLLKTVRTRSNPTFVFDPADITTQDALIKTILKERRIELLGEGFRVLDINRLLGTIPAKGSIPAVSPTDNGYIWPLPSSELATNSLLIDK